MQKIHGIWVFTNIPYNWEFTEDNKFIEKQTDQTLTNTGTWEIIDEMIIMKYDDLAIGYSVLSFDDENTLAGENKHRDGSMYNLNLKRKL